ncbi:MAG TPA: DsbA family protein [Pseudomonas sp.]
MTTESLELLYFFDPLCGWCYAGAPALQGLAERHGAALRMMPVGLFMQPRPIAAIAEHAWHNDQRIAELTGQRFSDSYRTQVLLAPQGVFDSTALTRALVALGEHDAALEPRLLHVTQLARYVDGVDTCRADVVAGIAVTVAASAGLALDADDFATRLHDDETLAAITQRRVSDARRAMHNLASTGVPQLLLRVKGHTEVLAGQALYSGADALLERIETAT